jgi:hypothetical protein
MVGRSPSTFGEGFIGVSRRRPSRASSSVVRLVVAGRKRCYVRTFGTPRGIRRDIVGRLGFDTADIGGRCLLNDRLRVCTMASDHCGLLKTPRAVKA